ncbi:MAG: hypothetical protein DRJ32_04715 [Thermoprotei archaeon]|nr:MAG: hypothetical protein DRJ32_04715 [Thermoprotei archaeon]
MANMNVYTNILLLMTASLSFYAIIYYMKLFKGYLLKRLNITVDSGIIIFRTKKLNRLLTLLALKNRKIVYLLSNISLILSLILMGYGIFFVHNNLLKFLYGSCNAMPVTPLIPFVTVSLEDLPYFIISVAIAVVTHEFAHGVVAIAENVPITSTGLFFFIILFGGFIEPLEDKFKRIKLSSKLRILAAGSTSNLIFSLLFLLALSLMFHPRDGVTVMNIIENTPAHQTLKRYDVILEINGERINTTQDFSLLMSKTRPYDDINLTIMRSGRILSLHVKLDKHPRNTSRGFLGVSVIQNLDFILPCEKTTVIILYRIFIWNAIICSSIAIVNMLPIFISDGGQMVRFILEKIVKSERVAERINILISLYFISILALNILFTWIQWGGILWTP